jgi:hypothetical protein
MRIFFALAIAASFAASIPSARAEEWCGFVDKGGSQVRCGFSSLAECKQALGDNKDGICMPSPSFAEEKRRRTG